MLSSNQDSIKKLLATLDPKAGPISIYIVDDNAKGDLVLTLTRTLLNISGDADTKKLKASGSYDKGTLSGSSDKLKLSGSGELTSSGEGNKLGASSGSSDNIVQDTQLKLEIVYAISVADAFEKCGAVVSKEEFEKLKTKVASTDEEESALAKEKSDFLKKVVADTKAKGAHIRPFDIVILDDQMPGILGHVACQTFIDLGISNSGNTISWSTTFANGRTYPGSDICLKKPSDREELLNPQGDFYKLIQATVKEKNEKVATQGLIFDDREILEKPTPPTKRQSSD